MPTLSSTPLVSVLMTVYNSAQTIQKAIDSLLAQTYTHWQLLIVDDASTDGLQEVMRANRDSRITIIYNEKNIGYVPCKNQLLGLIGGELACLLDADDWLRPDRISKQVEVFQRYPETMACMCAYMKVYADGREMPIRYYNESRFINVKRDEVIFPGGGMMFRREVVNKVGGFDMFFHKLFGDDSYWAFKIAERFPFYYLNETLYYYAANPASITVNFENKDKLTMSDLLAELKRQRVATGTDWLELGDTAQIQKYKQSLLDNKKWLAEKYREAAAIRIDFNDLVYAGNTLKKSFATYPFSVNLLKTCFYYLKKKKASRRL